VDYKLRDRAPEDGEAILAIFNHYVTSSPAAYFTEPVDSRFLGMLGQAAAGFPWLVIEDAAGAVAGFGLLHRYHPAPAFKQTAEVTYFIGPQHTRRGLGQRLLTAMEERARRRGITMLLASVASANEASLNFHRKQGFTECGRLKRVGRKFGRDFDVVWLQKSL